MSTNPYSSPDPLGDADSFGIPGKKQTPVAGIVLGILHVPYGLSMIVCNGISGVFFFVNLPTEVTEGNAAFEVMQVSAVFKFYNYAAMLTSVLSGFLFVLAGVGLLMLRPFGRWLSIRVALLEYALVLLSLIMNGIFLFPEIVRQIEMEAPGSPEHLGAITGLVIGLMALAIAAIYPSIVLFMMYRKSMMAAYRAEDATAGITA